MLALRREARLAFCQWRGILHDPRSGASAVRKVPTRLLPFVVMLPILIRRQNTSDGDSRAVGALLRGATSRAGPVSDRSGALRVATLV